MQSSAANLTEANLHQRTSPADLIGHANLIQRIRADTNAGMELFDEVSADLSVFDPLRTRTDQASSQYGWTLGLLWSCLPSVKPVANHGVDGQEQTSRHCPAQPHSMSKVIEAGNDNIQQPGNSVAVG
jgi:hypothetical protein